MNDHKHETRSYEQHGMTHTGTYSSWKAMVQRCTNPNHVAYENYGGRGITVCKAWLHSFSAFFTDMGYRPIGGSIDRIDNDRGYEPSNCQWTDGVQQARNRRIGRPSASGFTGVSFDKKSRKHRADIKFDGKSRYLGIFEDIRDAALARTHAEREAGGFPGDLDFRIKTLVHTPDPVIEIPADDDPILEPITSDELHEIQGCHQGCFQGAIA